MCGSETEWDDALWNNDKCYECTGYGDDYRLDENGEWVSACDDCPFNDSEEDE